MSGQVHRNLERFMIFLMLAGIFGMFQPWVFDFFWLGILDTVIGYHWLHGYFQYPAAQSRKRGQRHPNWQHLAHQTCFSKIQPVAFLVCIHLYGCISEIAAYQPTPSDKFTFGLWTVGNIGRDPFGGPVHPQLSAPEIVHLLADVGAYGVNFHDNDLIPIDATPAERDTIKKAFRNALDATGLKVPMATINPFSDPAFKDGAFTANDPQVRAYAIQKTLQGIDLGAEFGAKVYVFWGGREGVESDATKNPVDAIKHYREAIDFACEYINELIQTF